MAKECKTKIKASIDVCPDNLVEEMSRMVNKEGIKVNAAAKKYAKQFNKINRDKGISVSVSKVRNAYQRAAGLRARAKKDTENEGVKAHGNRKNRKSVKKTATKEPVSDTIVEHTKCLSAELLEEKAKNTKLLAIINKKKEKGGRSRKNTIDICTTIYSLDDSCSMDEFFDNRALLLRK